MSSPAAHPTRDELLAMAYVDDELAPEVRAELQRRLEREAELARQVADYQRLEVVARHAAAPEPMDHEWRRLAQDPVQRSGALVAWSLVALATVGGTAWIGWQIATSDLEPLPKALLAALVVGLLLLFLMTLRGRMRTMPYDPYTEVER